MKSQSVIEDELPVRENYAYQIPTSPLIVEITPQERNILSNVGTLLEKAFPNRGRCTSSPLPRPGRCHG